MTDARDRVDAQVRPLALLIGPRNAEAVTGWPWRWCRDQAVALGVPFLGAGRKRALRVEQFLAAIEKSDAYKNGNATNAVEPTAAPTLTPADPAAHVRALLGKTLKVAR